MLKPSLSYELSQRSQTILQRLLLTILLLYMKLLKQVQIRIFQQLLLLSKILLPKLTNSLLLFCSFLLYYIKVVQVYRCMLNPFILNFN